MPPVREARQHTTTSLGVANTSLVMAVASVTSVKLHSASGNIASTSLFVCLLPIPEDSRATGVTYMASCTGIELRMKRKVNTCSAGSKKQPAGIQWLSTHYASRSYTVEEHALKPREIISSVTFLPM